jgi:hypothetical protein
VYVAEQDGRHKRIYQGRGSITLSSSRSGDWLAIYEASSLFGIPQRLVFHNLRDRRQIRYEVRGGGGRWSPTRDEYFFVSTGASVTTFAFVRVVPGESPQNLLGADLLEQLSIAKVSPDYRYFVLVPPVGGRLYLADTVDGSITFVASSRHLQVTDWSTDSRIFAYATDAVYDSASPRLWLFDAETRESELLLEGTAIRRISLAKNGDILFTHPDGLFSFSPASGTTRAIHLQERMLGVFQTGDGNAVIASRDSCTTACEPGPLDTLVLAGKTVQTLPPKNVFSVFVQSTLGSTVFWGGSALITAESDGSWLRLEQSPKSVYRHVALSSNEAELAFVRSRQGGLIAVEVDVTTGQYSEMNVSPPLTRTMPAAALSTSTPAVANPAAYVPAPPAPCYARSGETRMSPNGAYVASVNQCLGGLILVEAKTGQWVLLIQPDWCRRFHADHASIAWRDDTHLQVVASGELC